jgi:hypothetical protein
VSAAVQATAAGSLRSLPPERLFDLANDVAPGQADVMKVAIGPFREFAALASALAPDVQVLAEPGENVRNMNICH